MNKLGTVVKNGKSLRFGYTTGSCATAAAAASTMMLLSQAVVNQLSITLPNGEKVAFSIVNAVITAQHAMCAVVKDAGDDPDVTNGMKIYARCERSESGVVIKGGDGVGVVTAHGLSSPVGEAAINPVPRKMILQNVLNICQQLGYKNGICVTISAPGGEAVAKRTFNPRLGIKGGISILGTTGIVEPMSEKALVDTIKVLIDQRHHTNAQNILIAPGNYGRDYCKNVLRIDNDKAIKFSNFVGETLDYLAYKQFKQVLMVGHVGKLVKLAGGIMNTHSAVADCRLEIFAAHCACLGASQSMVQTIMSCNTTDSVIQHLQTWGMCELVFKSIMEKIMFHLNYRIKGKFEIEVFMFGLNNQTMAQSEHADEFLTMFTEGYNGQG